MHASMVKPQDAVIVSVLAAVLALGLTMTTPMVGIQVVFGFLIVMVAFTSVPASLFLLIGSMLLSPEIAIGRVDGRGVGVRDLSLRVDDLLLVIIGSVGLSRRSSIAISPSFARPRSIAPSSIICWFVCSRR